MIRIINRLKYKLLFKIRTLNKEKNSLFDNSCLKGKFEIKSKLFNINNLKISVLDNEVLEYLAKMYLNHKFNYLGTGWIKNITVSPPQILTNTTDDNKVHNYSYIEWQKDVKSNYVWDRNILSKNIKIGILEGVDIKYPWEMARMHHLVRMAIIAHKLPKYRKQMLHEFKCQFYDFYFSNPVNYGVNWYNAMEAAIRVSNLLIAYDYFVQLDTEHLLDTGFNKLFLISIYQHGKFIFDNLEFGGNHFLANLTGLFFISFYLNGINKRINNWYNFAFKELLFEIDRQFFDDGGNFESSTYYHKLSVEFVIYSLVLVNRIGFKKHYYAKINNSLLKVKKAINLLEALQKRDGSMPQFGDNDSGKLFSFVPYGYFITNKEAIKKYINLDLYKKTLKKNELSEKFWYEDELNITSILSIGNYLFNNNSFNEKSFEVSFIKEIVKNNKLHYKKLNYTTVSQVVNKKSFNVEKYRYFKKVTFSSKFNLMSNLNAFCFPETGYYIFKSDYLYLAVNANIEGKKGGHSHNDKLSFELTIDNNEIFKDPGTYTYTRNPTLRKMFRHDNAHNVIHTSIDQNDISDIFYNSNGTKCNLFLFNNNTLVVGLRFKGVKQLRKFKIFKNKVIIEDYSTHRIIDIPVFSWFSPGYGIIEKVNI